jgi:hypothetical protein
MKPPIQKQLLSLLGFSTLVLLCLFLLGITAIESAAAGVSQREEAPGQMLYQYAQTLLYQIRL